MTNKLDMSKFKDFLDTATNEPKPEVPFTVPQPGAVTHKLTLRKGRAKNFRSIGNDFMEIDYQRNTATLVTSDDNGAGKSTMLVWLLFFVLYNDTYTKKERKAGLVNSQSRKDCVGEVEFACRGSEWKVCRGIKPDFVEVHQMIDGEWKQLENDAAKADVNKFIVNLIGLDQKMFENSLVLGKEKYIPFSEMGAADRRAMVETIWDLGFFSVMNEDVKKEIKRIDTQLTQVSNEFSMKLIDHTNKKTQLAQIIHSNELIQQQSAEVLVNEKRRLADLDANIVADQDELAHFLEVHEKAQNEIKDVVNRVNDEVTAEVQTIKEEYRVKIEKVISDAQDKADDYELNEVSHTKAEIQRLQTEIYARKDEIAKLVDQRQANQTSLAEVIARQQQGNGFRIRFQTEIEGHQSAIQRFHDMGVCPTCTQVVTEETKAGVVDKYQPQITDLEAKIEQVDQLLTNITTEIGSYQEKDAELKGLISVIETAVAELERQVQEMAQACIGFQRDIDGFFREAEIEKASLNREMQSKILSISQAANTRVDDITASLIRTRDSASGSIQTLRDKLGELNGRRAPIVASIADLERKLAVQPTPTIDLEMVIMGIEKSLSDLETQRQELDESLQDHNHLLYFLKDDQTKARIIALYLPFLNSKVNEYLESLNMFIDVNIDDTFEITMGAAGRKGQSIFSLSTGQRARLNLAIMLALREVANLKASVQCNLLVLDEILENMSERGVQESIEMLKHKFSGFNLFVISQREQEFQEYFQHNIRYGLRNGMTEVITKE